MAFDLGGFASGLGSGASMGMGLKRMMTKPQVPLAPGYEDPMQQMSVAGPADFAGAQQQPSQFGDLQDLLMRLFGR